MAKRKGIQYKSELSELAMLSAATCLFDGSIEVLHFTPWPDAESEKAKRICFDL